MNASQTKTSLLYAGAVIIVGLIYGTVFPSELSEIIIKCLSLAVGFALIAAILFLLNLAWKSNRLKERVLNPVSFIKIICSIMLMVLLGNMLANFTQPPSSSKPKANKSSDQWDEQLRKVKPIEPYWTSSKKQEVKDALMNQKDFQVLPKDIRERLVDCYVQKLILEFPIGYEYLNELQLQEAGKKIGKQCMKELFPDGFNTH